MIWRRIHLRLFWAGMLFLIMAGNTSVVRAQEKCNYAAEIVAQAREQARPNADRAQIERLSRLLERATARCQGDGDAWYYRYLFARQLGKTQEASFYRERAEYFGSEALRRNEDPFAPIATNPAKASSPSMPDPAKVGSASDQPSHSSVSYVREKWALVIGIGKFLDEEIPELNYAAKDAEKFAAVLRDPNYGRFKPENVTVLLNEKATTVEIKREIEKLIGKARPEDLVVFYLSSHGSPREGSTTGVNYVITHDTEKRSLYATSISMVRIVDDLNEMVKAQRVVMFLDTCYAGAAGSASVFGNRTDKGAKELKPEGQGVPEEILSRIGGSTGRVIIAASRPNEISWESEKLEHGIFTYYLINGLKQNNGLSSIKDVFDYLSIEVTKQVSSERKRTQQHPVLVTSEQGDQVDIRIGAAPKPANQSSSRR
jgi:hypothetical protein